MSKNYHVVSRDDSTKPLQSKPLAQMLAKDGQLILPMLDLLETAQFAVDDLIDVMRRATIEEANHKSCVLANDKKLAYPAGNYSIFNRPTLGKRIHNRT
jgi:hypothetical protein